MGLCAAVDEQGLLLTAGVFTMDEANDADTRRCSGRCSGKGRSKVRGAGLHVAGPHAGFTLEQLACFNAVADDQDEGGEWRGEDKLPEGSSVNGSFKGVVQGSAKGLAKGHQILRQRWLGSEEEVYGDNFAQVQVLM